MFCSLWERKQKRKKERERVENEGVHRRIWKKTSERCENYFWPNDLISSNNKTRFEADPRKWLCVLIQFAPVLK